MASFLEYMRQQQAQPAPSLVPDLSPIVGGLMQGYMQGNELRRQAEQDQMRRAQYEAEQKAAQRAQQLETLKADTALAQGLAEQGREAEAGQIWNQRIAPARGLLGYAQGPQLVGGRRQLGNDELMGMDEAAIRKSFTLGDQGQVGFTTQDFNNDTSRAAIRGLLDVAPQKLDELDPYKTYMRGGQVVQQAQPKPANPGSQYKVVNGQLVDLTTQQPVYTAPQQSSYAPVVIQRPDGSLGYGAFDRSQGTFNTDGGPAAPPKAQGKGSSAKPLTDAQVMERVSRYRNQLLQSAKVTARNNRITPVMQAAIDDQVTQYEATLRQGNAAKSASAQADTVAGEEAMRKQASDLAARDMAQLLKADQESVRQASPQEYDALLQYYMRRRMAALRKQPFTERAPINGQRLRELRSGSSKQAGESGGNRILAQVGIKRMTDLGE